MPQRKELNISYTLINTTIYTTLFSRPHKEMKLKSDSLSVTAGVFCFGWNKTVSNSFETVLFQFHFSGRTVLHNAYWSSYVVIQLSGLTFGLKGGQMSVALDVSGPSW